MKKIVLGYKGQIGKSIKKLFDVDIGIDLDTCKINNKEIKTDDLCVNWSDNKYFLHITIPYKNEEFIKVVKDKILEIKPFLTIIHSTCLPGTTRKLYEETNFPIVHAPVNGRHPDLIPDIKMYKMFVGSIKDEHGQIACEYIERHGIDTYLCSTPEITEISKIASTELIRVNVNFYQNMKSKIKGKNLNWAEFIAFMEEITKGNKTYNRVFQRAGEIDTKLSGKHCIKSNYEIIKNYE